MISVHFILFFLGGGDGLCRLTIGLFCSVHRERTTLSNIHTDTPATTPLPPTFFLVSSSCKAVRSLWLWLSHAASLNPDSARLTLAPTSISVIVHLNSVRFIKETMS